MLYSHAGDDLLTAHPFDVIASEYDTAFTHTRLGRWLRGAVRKWLAAFQAGDRVLDLGCGTGEDAIWLAQRGVHVTAIDAAPAMLEIAQRKAEAAGVAERLSFLCLDLAEISKWMPENRKVENFDGAFSNFGALNCLPDRRPIAQALARWVRPGGRLVLVVMGPLCPWEVLWHLGHGDVRTALRRFRSGVQARVGDGATVRVWYPSPRRLRSEFAPHFRHLETLGIGAFLPPTYLSHLVERWPLLFERVAVLDRRLGCVFPWTWLNDHYLMVFERNG